MEEILEHNTNDPYGYYDSYGNRHLFFCKKEALKFVKEYVIETLSKFE